LSLKIFDASPIFPRKARGETYVVILYGWAPDILEKYELAPKKFSRENPLGFICHAVSDGEKNYNTIDAWAQCLTGLPSLI